MLALSLGVPDDVAEPCRDDETLPHRNYLGFPYRGPLRDRHSCAEGERATV